jgi:cyclopropane-fatty-acyl-phospholipid synthase
LVIGPLLQIGRAIEDLFVIEDWHNFGVDYAPTALAWHDNFERNRPRLPARYDERFRRMWRYYLLSCAALFDTRRLCLWQIVLSPDGVPGGYRSVR